MRRPVRANVRASVDPLRHGSEILEHLIAQEGLVVLGAEYALETGTVDFLEEPANSGQRSDAPDPSPGSPG